MSEKLTVRHIDGPMLPQLHPFTSSSNKPQGNTSLVPTITPLKPGSSKKSQQYLLVPNPRNIVVRSMHHGRRVCVLVPKNDSDVIRALSLVWLPAARAEDAEESDEERDNVIDGSSGEGEWVILAGCNDGSVQEWSVSSLSLSHAEYCSSISVSAGTSSDDERKPRRVFQLECSTSDGKDDVNIESLEVLHLASPESSDEHVSEILANAKGGSLLFALVKGKSGESVKEPDTWLARCLIPSSRDKTNKEILSVHLNLIASIKVVDGKMSKEQMFRSQTRHVCMREGDHIFGFLAAYRPSESMASAGMSLDIAEGSNVSRKAGDVFVVMCSSFGMIVYHESANSNNSAPLDDDEYLSLVHFSSHTKQHVAHISPDTRLFSSVAISPDVKDIVLGRSDGRIDLLDDVFDCVMDYLVTFKGKMSEREGGDVSETIEELQHPHVSIIRRSVHWHSHPVMAVAFLSASGSRAFPSSMAKSLVSGGEESVLATWQLDRNFHRPTHFLARVSQGAIIHATCCPQSGKIVTSCADNSIRCHSGSNYDEFWVEQGLASMPLHQDDQPKGSIIMMKDPITNLPMLSNLPGAPGMIHWFDPSSKSVVGVLEAVPYNRVSRRDATKDPHIPAPSVTHMAIGRNGKDLVTTDMVWTENLSVGSSRNIIAPNKVSVPMNASTSIKFWVYKGTSSAKTHNRPSRQKPENDSLMNYELVSSMAAPHGREGSVCGLDLAPSGNVACTLSQEENAFRVWTKNNTSAEFLWKCLYKVKTPSGLSNLLASKLPSSHERLVSFSSDSSVLSVCYGTVVTMWDHSNATLLTSLTADASRSKEDIQQAHFMNKTDDTLLLITKSQVRTMSPFGGGSSQCYLGNDEWTFNAKDLGDSEGTLSAAIPLPGFGGSKGAGGFFVTSVASSNGKRSVISVVNREKGRLLSLDKTEDIAQWAIKGEVQSVCMNSCRGLAIQLLVITTDCNLVSLNIKSEDAGRTARAPSIKKKAAIESQSSAPMLKFITDDQEPSIKRRKIFFGLNTRSDNSEIGLDFPALTGKFTKAFIAKNNLGV